MKLKIDTILRHAEPQEYDLPSLSPDQMERIRVRTMEKIQQTTPKRRPLRMALVAAAAALFLCGSAFAAYETGWFGLQEIFGAQAEEAGDYAVTYNPSDPANTLEVTKPSYTPEEQKMISDGTMTVPDQAVLSGTGVAASTEDFTYTLETMLVAEDSLWAVVRADALTQEATEALSQMVQGFDEEDLIQAMEAAVLASGAQPEDNYFSYENAEAVDSFSLTASNSSGQGHEQELKNGAMTMTLLQAEGSTGHFLLTNSGGQFALGDKILFHELYHNVDLFALPVTALMENKATVSLEAQVYADKGYTMEQLTLTPLSLTITGHFTVSPDQSRPEVSVTLKDGTVFDLAGTQNGYAYTDYGSYGSLSSGGTAGGLDSDPFLRYSWIFSKAVALEEIDHITVDGRDYSLE